MSIDIAGMKESIARVAEAESDLTSARQDLDQILRKIVPKVLPGFTGSMDDLHGMLIHRTGQNHYIWISSAMKDTPELMACPAKLFAHIFKTSESAAQAWIDEPTVYQSCAHRHCGNTHRVFDSHSECDIAGHEAATKLAASSPWLCHAHILPTWQKDGGLGRDSLDVLQYLGKHEEVGKIKLLEIAKRHVIGFLEHAGLISMKALNQSVHSPKRYRLTDLGTKTLQRFI